MRLTAFQSDKGDCLLLTNTAGTARVLVDGGMPMSYDAHVAAAMGKLQIAKKALDIVYVSHIDQDHIGGHRHRAAQAKQQLQVDVLLQRRSLRERTQRRAEQA